MTTYAWTTDDDEVSFDSIMVGIGDDSAALIAAGTSPVEPVASVYWAEKLLQGDKVQAGMEGPYTIPEALQRAEELRALWDFNSVVITLQTRDTWRKEWGDLAELEGY
jgi:hypothetical protein